MLRGMRSILGEFHAAAESAGLSGRFLHLRSMLWHCPVSKRGDASARLQAVLKRAKLRRQTETQSITCCTPEQLGKGGKTSTRIAKEACPCKPIHHTRRTNGQNPSRNWPQLPQTFQDSPFPAKRIPSRLKSGMVSTEPARECTLQNCQSQRHEAAELPPKKLCYSAAVPKSLWRSKEPHETPIHRLHWPLTLTKSFASATVGLEVVYGSVNEAT